MTTRRLRLHALFDGSAVSGLRGRGVFASSAIVLLMSIAAIARGAAWVEAGGWIALFFSLFTLHVLIVGAWAWRELRPFVVPPSSGLAALPAAGVTIRGFIVGWPLARVGATEQGLWVGALLLPPLCVPWSALDSVEEAPGVWFGHRWIARVRVEARSASLSFTLPGETDAFEFSQGVRRFHGGGGESHADSGGRPGLRGEP